MKRFFIALPILLLTILAFSQSPGKISYQAVIRNTSDDLVKNTKIGMQISILQGSATGTAVYVEKQSSTTNANGLVSLAIGDGQIISGNLATIDWSNGTYFIKTETDLAGGTNYTISGINQLMGVPYAFHATTAESLTKPITETDPIYSAWDKSHGIHITESQITDLHHFTTADETDPVFKAWNKSNGIQITESQITDFDPFTTADEMDPRYAADSSFIKTGARGWNNSLAKKITAHDTTRWGLSETDPLFSNWDKSTGIRIKENQITDLEHFTNANETDPVFSTWNKSSGIHITESQITDLHHFTTADETDPVFRAWNKSTGIHITESQITDLHHFTNSDEIDPRYATDSSFIKSGVRGWNGSLAKKINNGDTIRWGRAETDPVFGAWNKSSGISITESQISDLHHFTNSDEIDPRYAADSSFIKSSVRGWNGSLAKKITTADTTYWGRAEIDPLFGAWNKSSGISITESQISDLHHFTNSDEIDPRFAADSSFIKSGVRVWNSSLAKKITTADTTYWGRAETDPVYSSSQAANITSTDITNLGNLSGTNTGDQDLSGLATKTALADTAAQLRSEIPDVSGFLSSESDPYYMTDSSFIKSGVRSWNSSLAKTINASDTTRWGQSSFDGNYSSLTNAPDIANSTATKTINLSTSTSSSSLTINSVSATPLLKVQGDGLVGINNVSSPRASLEVGGYDGLLVTGTKNVGAARALGAGVRFHWYPKKGALRAGEAETTYWDDDGSAYPKLALFSVGLGYHVRATGTASYAMGAYCHATGDYSLAMGAYSEATGSNSVAIGTGNSVPCSASGIYSIALGSGADTYGRDGSMVVGDDTYYQTAYSSADNQLTMRFSGGYRLWSSYPDSTAGVYMRHGASGWSNYCDRNKKTKFRELNYEKILKTIDEKVPITEWSYKKADTISRYIGPMAQDFYNAFQLGGDDSLGINSINEMGVSMAAIHGLIDRTDSLKIAVDELKLEKQKNAQLETMFREQGDMINQMRKELDDLKAEVSKSAIKSKDPITEK